jgi:hypothetical protein
LLQRNHTSHNEFVFILWKQGNVHRVRPRMVIPFIKERSNKN